MTPKKRQLYLVHTKGLGKHYVIAEDIKKASDQVTKYLDNGSLDSQGYGFSNDRIVLKVELLAREIQTTKSHGDNPKIYPFLSDLEAVPGLIVDDSAYEPGDTEASEF